ncbi:S1 RNA-binding domain-containing protein [Selenomonadales bacterium OttesenSCG-928-I06]|nr:S1 RNA-binding domain-containing protein [Selenomonadales bacterium OttesenSCG-928-I06]
MRTKMQNNNKFENKKTDFNNSKYKPGDVVTLKVARLSDLGAFLDAETGNTNDDILLHQMQQLDEVIDKIGQEVEVYLYLDPKGRLTASRRLPKIKVGETTRAEIINITKHGIFVDIGAERGAFMPFKEVREKDTLKRGAKVFIKLYRDKSNRIAATMNVDEDLKKIAQDASKAKKGDTVTGVVYNFIEQGAFLFTQENYLALLHNDEITHPIKIGDELETRITFVREDGKINVSMRKIKEKAISEDAEKILTFLQNRKGQMPYSDSTVPEIIKDKFQMSKAAFKRALGSLLKQGLIKQEDGWTYLVKDSLKEE